MQTFLPYADFTATADVLDPRRLGKQRVETIQVLRALTVPGYGWRHHPAARMWTGYEEALVRYGLEICDRWCGLGHGDTCAGTLVADLSERTGVRRPRDQDGLAVAGDLPPWLGDPAFHRSHRSALVRKDPVFYRSRFPDVPDDLPYVWPASDRRPHGKPAGG
ncbi:MULTISPECIES: MSMEG_6728 family protein [Actinomadura]|uniref:Cytoplasmic protein n=1 Tax=Actinomadura madurae TaxID=1993 RepID=A0A1I5J1Y0_9ACTN|nr:MSMEG_6728 family protein [Actinomadura madurae]SFO66381.1 hypothetical protein SAMN04489713_108220 [Actinomadura madurae]SPT58568.1 Uncharacterised protein [Actinomadura madurae]